MMIINKKYKNTIEEYKRAIKASQVYQDNMFAVLCDDIGIEDGTPEAEALWDHIFNDTDWTITYSKNECRQRK